MWNCMTNFGSHSWGIGSIVFIVAVVLLTYALVKVTAGQKVNRNHVNDKNDSLEILKTRLARGEITTEEFERLKSYL